MRQCVSGHAEITWYNDGVTCPVCQAMEKTAEALAEVALLKENVRDLESEKIARIEGGKHAEKSSFLASSGGKSISSIEDAE
jgi:hypothetical protein